MFSLIADFPARRSLVSAAVLAALSAAAAPAMASPVTYHVTVNTAPLVGNANAPFYVDFQFNTGGGPFANSATISNFDFGGGSPSGSAIVYAGDPTGDLGTAFSLSTGISAFNEIAQQFNPGQTLAFDVTLSGNGGTQAPDAFVFSIDDASTYDIPTTSPAIGTAPDNTGLLAEIDINPAYSNPAFSTFAYSGTGEYSGVTVSVVPVPVPAAAWLFGSALGLLGFRRRQA